MSNDGRSIGDTIRSQTGSPSASSSGWSYGGPYVTPDLAAARLRVDRREIAPSVRSIARPVPFPGDRLLAAFVGRGSLQEADPRTVMPDLGVSAEDARDITAYLYTLP